MFDRHYHYLQYFDRHCHDVENKNFTNPWFRQIWITFCAFKENITTYINSYERKSSDSRAISIDLSRKCAIVYLYPHPDWPNHYYICDNTKTILAKCNSGTIFDKRLKRCIVGTQLFKENDDSRLVNKPLSNKDDATILTDSAVTYSSSWPTSTESPVLLSFSTQNLLTTEAYPTMESITRLDYTTTAISTITVLQEFTTLVTVPERSETMKQMTRVDITKSITETKEITTKSAATVSTTASDYTITEKSKLDVSHESTTPKIVPEQSETTKQMAIVDTTESITETKEIKTAESAATVSTTITDYTTTEKSNIDLCHESTTPVTIPEQSETTKRTATVETTEMIIGSGESLAKSAATERITALDYTTTKKSKIDVYHESTTAVTVPKQYETTKHMTIVDTTESISETKEIAITESAATVSTTASDYTITEKSNIDVSHESTTPIIVPEQSETTKQMAIVDTTESITETKEIKTAESAATVSTTMTDYTTTEKSKIDLSHESTTPVTIPEQSETTKRTATVESTEMIIGSEESLAKSAATERITASDYTTTKKSKIDVYHESTTAVTVPEQSETTKQMTIVDTTESISETKEIAITETAATVSTTATDYNTKKNSLIKVPQKSTTPVTVSEQSKATKQTTIVDTTKSITETKEITTGSAATVSMTASDYTTKENSLKFSQKSTTPVTVSEQSKTTNQATVDTTESIIRSKEDKTTEFAVTETITASDYTTTKKSNIDVFQKSTTPVTVPEQSKSTKQTTAVNTTESIIGSEENITTESIATETIPASDYTTKKLNIDVSHESSTPVTVPYQLATMKQMTIVDTTESITETKEITTKSAATVSTTASDYTITEKSNINVSHESTTPIIVPEQSETTEQMAIVDTTESITETKEITTESAAKVSTTATDYTTENSLIKVPQKATTSVTLDTTDMIIGSEENTTESVATETFTALDLITGTSTSEISQEYTTLVKSESMEDTTIDSITASTTEI